MISLQQGYTIIFQNFFYIPIILACLLYVWRGFFFSCILAFLYFGMVAWYTQDSSVILQASMRVIIFGFIALVITLLASYGNQSGESLRHLMEFQESIITNARVWIMVLDEKGNIRLWNHAAEEISGYSSSEVINSNAIWKHLYPEKEYRNQITDTITRIITNREYLENFETSIQTKNHEKKIISWNTKGIPGRKKEKTNFIAIGVDITDNYLTREALHLKEFAIASSLNAICFSDLSGNLTYVNPSFLSIVGYTNPGEVIGKSVYSFIRKTEKKAELQDGITRYGTWLGELQAQKKDGEIVDVLLSANNILDNHQSPIAMMGSFIDITKRKKIETELRNQSQFLQVLIDTLPVPIFYKNTEGLYLGCNSAFEQYFGKSRDQVIGISVFDFAPKEQAEIYFQADQEVFRSLTVQKYEATTTYADGSIHQVIFYKAPYFDESSRVIGLIGAFLDISERKRSEEMLQEANNKLRLLTGLTRHDIYNQLNVVQLLHQMAQASSDPKVIHSYISRAEEAGKQISATIGFTREYENFGTTSGGWQNIRKIIELASHEVAFGNVVLENLISDRTEVYADPIIRKVFATLMENGIRHGEKISYIRFSASVKENILVITCEDDGVGVLEQEKKLIFDSGFGKNTGIGLFLSREILSITGLSIVENGIPGKGARFEILVPTEKFKQTDSIHQ